MIKYAATIQLLVVLFTATPTHAQRIDDLVEQIVETAKQRTVRFNFIQSTATRDTEIVGRGQGLYQAPGARMDVNLDTPNGEVGTIILTDGQTLWHIVSTGQGAPRRVVIYDLSSPEDRGVAMDPFLALGGIGTRAFAELAGDRLRLASSADQAETLKIQLLGNRQGEGSAEFLLGRSDLFPRGMTVLGPNREPRAQVTVDSVRFGDPVAPTTFAYVKEEGDLILRAAELSESQSAPSPAGLEGKSAPSFALPSVTGSTISLESLRGKFVLIDFWATWCPPCRMALPHIQKLSQERGDLTVVTISSDPLEVAREFLDDNAYTFATLIDQSHAVSRSYGVTGIPTTFILGPDGTIRKHLVGYHTEPQLRAALALAGLAN